MEAPGIESPATSAPRVADRRVDDADRATQDDAKRREVSASGDVVEAALAKAIDAEVHEPSPPCLGSTAKEIAGCLVALVATCDHLAVTQSKASKALPKREGFFNQLTRESERGTALIAGEACNERLGLMLERLFVAGSSTKLLRGPLGRFSSRIDACFALGLISSDERDDLARIAKIRNSAAHFVGGSNHFSFAETTTAAHCRDLRAKSPPFMAEVERELGARGEFIGKFVGIFNALEARMNAVAKGRSPA